MTCLPRTRIAVSLLEGRGYRPVRRYYEMRIMLGDEAPPEPSGPKGSPWRRFATATGPSSTRLHRGVQGRVGGTPMEYEEWRRARIEADDVEPASSGRSFATATRSWRLLAATRIGTAAAGWPASACASAGAGAGSGSHCFSARFASSTRGRAQRRPRRRLENPTGATRLYERAGMHVECEAVTFEKSLA